jgi:hypothetical protein
MHAKLAAHVPSALQVWLPANVVFVLMLSSGIVSLHNIYVWMCLFLIIASACTGMSTDLAFSWSGYGFQLANCCFTAGYSLLLRGTMDKVRLRWTPDAGLRSFSQPQKNMFRSNR